jgi:hypothetical protein
MRWLLPVVVLLVGTVARGGDACTTVVGKVVAVPDGGSLWVYLETARACYHFTLSGIQAPPADQPLGRSTRETLTQMVLGRVVQVRVHELRDVGEIPGEVVLDGKSVNTQIARLLYPENGSAPVVAQREYSPRRPLLAVCQALRHLLPGQIAWSGAGR